MHVTGVHLELVLALEDVAGADELLDLVDDGQHGDVGLAGAGGCADEQVLVGAVGRLEHHRLDAIQRLAVGEGAPTNSVQRRHRYQVLAHLGRRRLVHLCWHRISYE